MISKVKCKLLGHSWAGCKCDRCGELRDEEHSFQPIEGKCKQQCSVCDQVEALPHQWVDNKCTRCGKSKGFFTKHLPFLHLEKTQNRILLGTGALMVAIFIFIGIMATLEQPSNDLDTTPVSNYVDETESMKESDVIDEKLPTTYDVAIGKLAIDIYGELSELGYTVSFKHAVTKMDYTESVLSIDPSDTEWYIPWIVTSVDSYKPESKTASFSINTQEAIDEAKNQTIVKGGPDEDNAMTAFKFYGEELYPYGFKCHWVRETYNRTQAADGSWTIKVGVTITNEYGIERKAVAEGTVGGTANKPVVTYFNVY